MDRIWTSRGRGLCGRVGVRGKKGGIGHRFPSPQIIFNLAESLADRSDSTGDNASYWPRLGSQDRVQEESGFLKILCLLT